jgi:predicted aconitase
MIHFQEIRVYALSFPFPLNMTPFARLQVLTSIQESVSRLNPNLNSFHCSSTISCTPLKQLLRVLIMRSTPPYQETKAVVVELYCPTKDLTISDCKY